MPDHEQPPPAQAPSADQFADLFPFNFVVDRGDRLKQAGRLLRKVAPELGPGAILSEHVRPIRPAGCGPLGLCTPDQRRSLVILIVRATQLQLRGQLLQLESGDTMFLGSPWFTDSEEIRQLGLPLDEFPIHDSTLDLINAIQAQRMAAQDHGRLVERLKTQRAHLQQTIALLHQREAEASKLALVAARTYSSVVITDSIGRIEWVNESFERMTGFKSAEVIGRCPGHFLQGPETDPATVALMRTRIEAKQGFEVDLINYHRDGRRYWVRIEAQPVTDESGTTRNFIAIEQDVSARVQAERRRRLQESVSVVIAQSDSIESGLPEVLKEIAEVTGAVGGVCWPIETDAGSQPFAVWERCETGTAAMLGARLQITRDLAGMALSGRASEFFPAVGKDWPALVILCRAENRVVGAMVLTSPDLAAPDPELLLLLDSFGGLIGQFVDRTLARRELQRSRDFALMVMDMMGQGLSVTNARGVFTYVNPAYSRLVGIPSEELLGRTPDDISPVSDHKMLEQVRLDRKQGRSSSYELRLQRPDGAAVPVLVTGVPRMDGDEFGGTIAVITDITAQKQVEQQIELALVRERELNALKSSFVTMASHEFRTPLTGIYYAAEMMGSHVKALPEATGARQQRYLDIILDGAKRMSDLMNDLLLLGRIESGKLECAPAEVELVALLEDLRRQASGGNGRIEIRIAPDSPVQLLLDSNLLCHALLNLLSNALKYSPAPLPVILSAETELAADGSSRLCVSVADSGCGIPPADQEKLFQPFFRAGNVGKIRGTGIGLTIARDCARLHGGELSFVSEVGKGTTFRLSVPLQVPEKPAAESSAG